MEADRALYFRWNAAAEKANGAPHSQQRIQQVDRLQAQGKADERCGRIGTLVTVPCPVNIAASSQQFRQWLLSLQEGTNIARSAFAKGRSSYDYLSTPEELELYRGVRARVGLGLQKVWTSTYSAGEAMARLDDPVGANLIDKDALYHIRCRACGDEVFGMMATGHRCPKREAPLPAKDKNGDDDDEGNRSIGRSESYAFRWRCPDGRADG